jgi:hypothetical protein
MIARFNQQCIQVKTVSERVIENAFVRVGRFEQRIADAISRNHIVRQSNHGNSSAYCTALAHFRPNYAS